MASDTSPPTPNPRFTLSLTPTSKLCNLTGTPRFGFALTILSHEKHQVITVCLHKTPLKEFHGLGEILYATDDDEGQEVEWPYGIGCWEDDDPFPDDLYFEEFRPGVPYERMFWVDKDDPATAQGGELGELEAGKEYTVRVSEELLEAFSKWRRGGKEELLAGGLKEKKDGWKDGSGKISFDVSEPFTFKAV